MTSRAADIIQCQHHYHFNGIDGTMAIKAFSDSEFLISGCQWSAAMLGVDSIQSLELIKAVKVPFLASFMRICCPVMIKLALLGR